MGATGTSICKSLVALSVDGKPQLFQFDANGAPERATSDLPFVALGSGQLIADPFLAFLKRLLWSGREPTIAEGRLAAAWTIGHVNRTNPGGVGGRIQVAVLSAKAGKGYTTTLLERHDVDEHQQRIEAAEQALIAALRGAPPPGPPIAAPPPEAPPPS